MPVAMIMFQRRQKSKRDPTLRSIEREAPFDPRPYAPRNCTGSDVSLTTHVPRLSMLISNSTRTSNPGQSRTPVYGCISSCTVLSRGHQADFTVSEWHRFAYPGGFSLGVSEGRGKGTNY